MAEKTKVTLKVKGMSCQHCVARVEKALKGVKGVSSAQVSLERASATVEYQPDQVKTDDLKRAVKTAGYEAE